MHRSPPSADAGPLTLEEFERVPELDARLELSKGLLVREPQPEARHGAVVVNVLRSLDAVARDGQLGRAVVEADFHLTETPPTVRRPDAVEVWRPGLYVQARREDDRLEGEDVLPGFGVLVHELFAV